MDYSKADKKVHKVEDHWSYKYLIPAGFKPLNKTAVGLVRSFQYRKGDEIITATTGYSSDRWSSTKGERGYWMDLVKYLVG